MVTELPNITKLISQGTKLDYNDHTSICVTTVEH